MRARALVSAVALFAALSGAALASAPAPASRPTLLTHSPLRRCDLGQPRPFRCGSIAVPANRRQPDGRKLHVGFAVRRHTDLRHRSLGTIIGVEGGPGYAATDQPYASSLIAVLRPLLRRRDLVLIDARGTGTSGALLCNELQRGLIDEQIAVGQCARRLGNRFSDYTTAETVADIEAVRRSLGLGRVFLYGDSYGTLQGQAYAARYESGLRGLILDSAYPGNDPYYRTLLPAGRRGLRITCRRSPVCSGNALGRFKRVVARFHAAGLPTGNLLGFLLEAGTLAPQSYLNLDQADRLFLHGHPRRLGKLTNPGAPGHGDVKAFSYGLEVAVECNDYPTMWDKRASDVKRRAQLGSAVKGLPPRFFSPFGRREYLLSEEAHLVTCLNWPQPPKGGLEPPVPRHWRASARFPTLILAGEVDDITSVAEARQVARRFPRSRLYIVADRGHASPLYFPFTSPGTPVIRNFIRRH